MLYIQGRLCSGKVLQGKGVSNEKVLVVVGMYMQWTNAHALRNCSLCEGIRGLWEGVCSGDII